MTARETFTKGQVVVLTVEGHSMRPHAGRRGVVTGFGRQPHLVQVRPDGCKTAMSYHMKFWRPLTAVEAAATCISQG